MPSISRQALSAYSAEQLYDLVNDIAAYPEFLPWCPAVTVHKQTESFAEATIHIGKGRVEHGFTTVNTMQPGRKIKLELKDGPFSHLRGLWLFKPLGEAGSDVSGTKVSVELDFEFASRAADFALRPIFNEIANSLLNAFLERANTVYG